ncbi:carboxypeptidase-like regulatory domain-containing protein [Flavobacteriaceae bacterium XHP0103]|uniref:M56 family metallopeptidase n=1 Tax=Marixanthotalea marina TaxID=2844359 RepID=UPI00298A060E|nr:carboxypeptidase-like regulatory domain-containing protein [Marixanthotalea marina]MBU3822469.1 carboxypeptidase-like regulatory domain-containing protein [Marixanthotalea marina]
MEYLLKVSAIIAIFYVCYKLFLQRDTFFEANRWFLMLGLLTSFVLPFIVIPIYIEYTPITVSGFPINEITPPAPTEKPFNPLDYIPFVYGLGAAFFTVRFLVQLTSLAKLILKDKGRKESKFTFIETDDETPPFSFFNWIVYNPNQFNQEELAQIIAHEKTHAKQYHSIDILLTQICCVLLWFNPFIWLYNKDLKQNLEFIADKSTLNLYNCKKSYQYTLLKTSMPSHQMALGNAFYNSLTRLNVLGYTFTVIGRNGQVKKRIVMLHKSKSKKRNQLKYALVIPVLALFLMSFNTKEVFIAKVSENNTTTKEVAETYVINKNTSDTELSDIESKITENGASFTYALKRDSNGNIKDLQFEIVDNGNGKYQSKPPFEKVYFGTFSNGGIFITENEEGIKKMQERMNDLIEKNKVQQKSQNQQSPWKVSEERNNIIFASADTLYVNESPNTIEKLLARFDETPLYLIDGKEVSEKEISEVNPLLIESVLTTQGSDNTIKEYGNKAKNGVLSVKLRSKPVINVNQTIKLKSDALYLVNGKETSYDELNKLNPETIKSIRPLNDENQIKKYGNKSKNGVFVVETDTKWETNFIVGKAFSSEQVTISGKVINQKGEALPGVNVIVKDGKTGTATDFDGNYEIKVNKGDYLIFSYKGMVSQIINAKNNETVNVTLSPDTASNSKPQSAWTTSLSLNENNTQTQSKTQKNTIIKGVGSFSEAPPLYIVNGEEVSGNIAKSIDPNNIESMTVLKEENQIKQYGEKGKNGVILITLKESSIKFSDDVKVIGYGTKPSDTKFTIKAVSNLNGEPPLIIVDGNKIKTKNFEIYNDNIESMNVLKGETATKKYGEEGKNGVIEITTKK